ncbi:MAG: hypothetical protein ACFFCS_25000 [Candidatus Hodarchaeota archaeon]
MDPRRRKDNARRLRAKMKEQKDEDHGSDSIGWIRRFGGRMDKFDASL